jgi:hypothetical protein
MIGEFRRGYLEARYGVGRDDLVTQIEFAILKNKYRFRNEFRNRRFDFDVFKLYTHAKIFCRLSLCARKFYL